MRHVFHILQAGLLLAATSFAADLESGKNLFEKQKYAEAEKNFREMVNAEPDNLEANYYLGASLVELNKYEESEPFLKKAAAEKPEADIALAHAYLMQEHMKEAQETLDIAQKRVDEAAAETAKEEAEKMAMYKAQNGEIARYRGMMALKQNKFDDAFKQLSNAAELNPKDAYAHYYLAMASSRIKRPDQMVKHFQMFLQLAPDAPEAPKVKSLLKAL
jgi:tetratricopeptide (TPR) repeat protein